MKTDEMLDMQRSAKKKYACLAILQVFEGMSDRRLVVVPLQTKALWPHPYV
jgi:hypothetical protein